MGPAGPMGPPGPPGPRSLIRLVADPDVCPGGGQRVEVGADVDGDGALDPEEVQSSRSICLPPVDGVPMRSQLDDTHTPPSAACRYGGIGLRLWADANHDGLFDPGEITQVLPVCLLRAPRAGTCSRSYLRRIADGYDLNLNGVLDPNEERSECNEAVVSAASGLTFSCEANSLGDVKCWGENWAGQLGDGTTITRLTPTRVASGVGSTAAVAAGTYHACALSRSGEVACWGYNAGGQLGNGNHVNSTTPVEVAGLVGVAALAPGESHTCALITDGTVKCWGDNSRGQLGTGNNVTSLTPVQVTGLGGVTSLAVGFYHGCAAHAGGQVSCWGANNDGQLGTGGTSDSTTPLMVAGLSGPTTRLGLGFAHSCALLASGAVQCWGWGGYGQLGHGGLESSLSPGTVSGLSDAVSIGAGVLHTCAARSNGTVVCWGDNGESQLGDGTQIFRLSPVAVVGLSGVAQLSVGGYHACVINEQGTMDAWGWDQGGQQGDGLPASDRPLAGPVLDVP